MTLSFARLGSFCVWVYILCQVAAAGSPQGVIRIAHIYPETESFLPVQYMMEKFLNSTAPRVIVPDYDVVVDPIPIASNTGEASVQLIRALLADTSYHAVTGPWQNLDCLDTVNLTSQARVLQVLFSDTVELTDKPEQYPFFFRSARSADGDIHTWMYMAAVLQWSAILSIWADGASVDRSTFWAEKYNMSNNPVLASVGEEWQVEAWQRNAATLLRRNRLKVVMTKLPTHYDMYRFVCYMDRQTGAQLQYFAEGRYPPGWYLFDYPPELGDCTDDEMYMAVGGVIFSSHTVMAPGVNSTLGIAMPSVDGQDESGNTMTCMPDQTVLDFYNGGELMLRGFLEGAWTDPGSLQLFLGMSVWSLDGICALLLAFHDFLYNKDMTLQEVEQRQKHAFESLHASMSAVELQGPGGRFRFYDTGDPEVTFFILGQTARPGFANNSAHLMATSSFPFGTTAPPAFALVDPDRDFLWRDGSTGLTPHPQLAFLPACGDLNAELVWDRCVPCSEGTFYDSLLDACRTCPIGDYQNESGKSDCITASPGWYVSNVEHPVEATLCPIGHECPSIGTVTPRQCSLGRYANNTGRASCALCDEGFFQDNLASTACLSCESILPGSTTARLASTSASQCICPVATFRAEGGSSCSSCLEGLICPAGSDMSSVETYPQVEKGYMTLASAPLTVYSCKLEKHCPGGPPAMCAPYRDASTVACGDCADQAYEAGEECEACGEVTALPLVLAGIGGFSLVVAATIIINKDVHKTPAASFMVVAMTGMLFTSLQAFGVFSQMSIPWVEPVKTVLRLSQVLSFDLKLLKVSCVMGVNPVRAFAVRQLVPVLAIPFITVTLLVKKMAPRIGKPQTRILIELTNAVGTLYSLFFISIVISAIDPFLCYRHPGSSGESVLSAPSLLCFESDLHTAMVLIGLVAMFVIPVPFLCLCGYGAWMYPRYMRLHDTSAFLHALRFLFFRYTPRRYYFQTILLSRSALICLVPAIFRGRPSTQALLMIMVLAIYIAVQSTQSPWRAWLCNPLDSAMNIMLAVMLTCGALFLEDTPEEHVIAALCVCALAVLVLTSLAGIFVAIKIRLVPSPFYDFFVCHHKAHAAAQARYLKTLLQAKRPSAKVFLDSDDLQQLDTLFDTVKSRLRHLVVYLTSETLRRPWCAGEVVTALRAKLLVTQLWTMFFVRPSEEQIANPEVYIDVAGCNLSAYGITWADVTAAFEQLLDTTPRLDLSLQALGTHRFHLAAASLLKQRVEEPKVALLAAVETCSVLVSTDAGSDEASASGGILLARISKDIYQASEERACLVADFAFDTVSAKRLSQNARAVIIILSHGCLHSLEFASLLCEVQQYQEDAGASSPTLVSVNIPGFEFLAGPALSSIKCMDELQRSHGSLAQSLLASFFKNISIALPIHASQDALDTQCDGIFRSISARLRGVGSKSSPMSSARASSERMPSRSPPGLEASERTPSRSAPGADGATSRWGSTSVRGEQPTWELAV